MIKRITIRLFIICILLLIPSTAQSQSSSNTNANLNTSFSEETNKTVVQPVAENPRIKVIRDGLKTIADGSKDLSGWCLLIIAASIAVIVKTSNFSPVGKGIRSMYLLFISGWLFLAFSMYEGNLVARHFMAAMLNPKLEDLLEIGKLINIDFANQLRMFEIGLASFIIWLLMYLFWWIYYYKPEVK